MVKKSMKKVAMLFTVLSLGSVVVPGIVSSGVYAESVNGSSVVPNRNAVSITLEQKENLIKELKENYPSLSEKYLREMVEKLLRGETIFTSRGVRGARLFFLGIWDDEGLTVEAAGAALDATISVMLGGATVEALKHLATSEAKHIIRNAIASVFGVAVGSWVVSYVLAFSSPGRAFAEWWDTQDAYPYNRHINF